MASTAWTATRDELVKRLDIVTRERELWRTRAETAATKRHALRGEAAIRQARHRENARAKAIAEQATDDARLIEAFARTMPDPNAELHRRTLIAALKEKP